VLSLTQPLPTSSANQESTDAAPWFVVLANGLKCARAGSGTNTDVLSYECNGGTFATSPDRSQPNWTVKVGSFQNGSPSLSPTPVVVKAAYR
jgi:hypothetical protein